jgi:hypothetical protein
MNVLDKVTTLSRPFLGPAADQFIARQCKTHLKIEPADLLMSQLSDLAKRVEISAGLIMDPSKAKALAQKIATMT